MKKKIIIAFVVIVVLVFGGTLGYQKVIAPMMTYNAAKEQLKSGKYDEAKKVFNEMGSYSDASNMVKECDYQKAEDLVKKQEYDKAIEVFESLGDYRKSSDKVLETTYSKGMNCMKNQEYSMAEYTFDKLGDYSDAKDQAKEACYLNGKKAMELKEYDLAESCFSELKGYKDSSDLVKECGYYDAINSGYSVKKAYKKLCKYPNSYKEVRKYKKLCKKYIPYVGKEYMTRNDYYSYMEENIWFSESLMKINNAVYIFTPKYKLQNKKILWSCGLNDVEFRLQKSIKANVTYVTFAGGDKCDYKNGKIIVTNKKGDKMTMVHKNGKIYAKVKCHKYGFGVKSFVFKRHK